jgi:hypothetical protein
MISKINRLIKRLVKKQNLGVQGVSEIDQYFYIYISVIDTDSY